MNTFRLTITTPSSVKYDGEVERISLRGTEGEFAVMAGHIPFVTSTRPGRCKIILPGGEEKEATCGEGLITVAKELTSYLPTTFEWDDEGAARES